MTPRERQLRQNLVIEFGVQLSIREFTDILAIAISTAAIVGELTPQAWFQIVSDVAGPLPQRPTIRVGGLDYGDANAILMQAIAAGR